MRRFNIRVFARCALAVIAVLALQMPALAEDAGRRVKASGTVRVCVWPDYYGVTHRNANTHKLEGIDIDLSNELARDLQVKVQHVDSSFVTLIDDLQNDRCDIAMFAVGIMTTPGLIGEQFYATLSIPWVPSLLADQNTAGQITWFTGEVPAFIAIVMLAAQWFRSDSRVAKAGDRRADQDGDQELRAYNEMLAELAARDTSMERSRRDVD